MGPFLGVPVRAGPNLFGNLYLTDKEGGFTEEDEALVEALAMIAGTAIRTVRLQRRLQSLAVAEDRERIARDLHDAIIQNLFAVGLSLQGQALKVVDPEDSEGARAGCREPRPDDHVTARIHLRSRFPGR